MKLDDIGNVHVRYSVSIRKTKSLTIKVLANPSEAPSSHRSFPSIDKGHSPTLGTVSMDLHLILVQINSYVCHLKVIIYKILFDYRTTVTAAYDKVIDAVC